MRLAYILFSIILAVFIYPSKAHAIIFLPAIILIPIAKIVAFIIAGFSFPALGIGVLTTKLFKKSFMEIMKLAIFILVFITIALVIFLKIQNPDRPLF